MYRLSNNLMDMSSTWKGMQIQGRNLIELLNECENVY